MEVMTAKLLSSLNNRTEIEDPKQTHVDAAPNEPKDSSESRHWSNAEDVQLQHQVSFYDAAKSDDPEEAVWVKISQSIVPQRTPKVCFDRWTQLLSQDLAARFKGCTRKGTWTDEEDYLLRRLIRRTPYKHWGAIAAQMPGRTAKQCRERWCYSLDPAINKNPWTDEEDKILIREQRKLGNRWAFIASMLPGRTENAVKTRYKSILRAKQREWTEQEDSIIITMHQKLGSK